MFENAFVLYKYALLNIFVIIKFFVGPPLLGAPYGLKCKGGHISKRTNDTNSFLCIMGTRHTIDDESMAKSARQFEMP